MLQLRQEFLEGPVTFLFEHNKDDHEDGVSSPNEGPGTKFRTSSHLENFKI